MYVVLAVWQFLIAIPLCLSSLLSAVLSQILFICLTVGLMLLFFLEYPLEHSCLSSCCLTLFACVCTILIVFVCLPKWNCVNAFFLNHSSMDYNFLILRYFYWSSKLPLKIYNIFRCSMHLINTTNTYIFFLFPHSVY